MCITYLEAGYAHEPNAVTGSIKPPRDDTTEAPMFKLMSTLRPALAASLLLFATNAPALEIKVREVIRGAFVPLSADSEAAKEEAKAAAKKSHEEKCAAWTLEAKTQLGASALFVSCGARED